MIADPAEEDFPFRGRTLFEEPGSKRDVLFGRAEAARDLEIPGRELDGVYFAMDYLTQQNKDYFLPAFEDALSQVLLQPLGEEHLCS